VKRFLFSALLLAANGAAHCVIDAEEATAFLTSGT